MFPFTPGVDSSSRTGKPIRKAQRFSDCPRSFQVEHKIDSHNVTVSCLGRTMTAVGHHSVPNSVGQQTLSTYRSPASVAFSEATDRTKYTYMGREYERVTSVPSACETQYNVTCAPRNVLTPKLR